METRLPSEEELHAFIDGEMEPGRAEAFAEIVAASPRLTELVERYQADKDLIAQVYGPLIERPLPIALVEAAAGRRPAASRRFTTVYRAAIALAATVAIVWVGYPIAARLMTDPLVAEALAIRSGAVTADATIASEAMTDTVRRDRFADDALATPIRIPDLEKAGYELAAVATYPEMGGHHAVQLSYRGRDGQTFTMFLRPSKGPDRFELKRHADLQVCVWQDDDLSVVMLGTMSAREMLKIATATYADLNF
jgi:anti-sigma factor RsiW